MTRPILLLVLLVAACGGRTTNAARTERQTDSVLAHSKVPGAAAVQRAMVVSDSARSRVMKEDSAATPP